MAIQNLGGGFVFESSASAKSSFKEFYAGLGLDEYPFSIYTTENERDYDQLFVQPADYSPIIESFEAGRTMILVGNRGAGKTALLQDMIGKKMIEKVLCVQSTISLK